MTTYSRIREAGIDLETATKIFEIVENQINDYYELIFNQIVFEKKDKLYLDTIGKIIEFLRIEFNRPKKNIFFFENRKYETRGEAKGSKSKEGDGLELGSYKIKQLTKLHMHTKPGPGNSLIEGLTADVRKFLSNPPDMMPRVFLEKRSKEYFLRIPVVFNAGHLNFNIAEPVVLGVFYVHLGKESLGEADNRFLEYVAKLHESQIDKLIGLVQNFQEINLRNSFDRIVDKKSGSVNKKIEMLLKLILDHTEAELAILGIGQSDFVWPTDKKVQDSAQFRKYITRIAANSKLKMHYQENPTENDQIIMPIFHPAEKDNLLGGIGLYIGNKKDVFSLFDIHLVQTFVTLIDTFIVHVKEKTG